MVSQIRRVRHDAAKYKKGPKALARFLKICELDRLAIEREMLNVPLSRKTHPEAYYA